MNLILIPEFMDKEFKLFVAICGGTHSTEGLCGRQVDLYSSLVSQYRPVGELQVQSELKLIKFN